MSENKIDVNTPPTAEEVENYLNNLSDADKEQVRRHQLFNAAVNRQPDKAPNFGAMTNEEFRAYCRQFGF